MNVAGYINASVAIKNNSRINLEMAFNQEKIQYPAGGRVKIVPYAVALQHFGFELSPNGQIYRNTADKDDDGDETQYHAARASFLPWGWMGSDDPVDGRTVRDSKTGEYHVRDATPRREKFEAIKDAWENHIEAKLVSMPREMTEQQFAALPV